MSRCQKLLAAVGCVRSNQLWYGWFNFAWRTTDWTV